MLVIAIRILEHNNVTALQLTIGRIFSYQAPVPPKMNLFTSRWSPISRVPSMEAEES